jgi:hypothetical protein
MISKRDILYLPGMYFSREDKPYNKDTLNSLQGKARPTCCITSDATTHGDPGLAAVRKNHYKYSVFIYVY